MRAGGRHDEDNARRWLFDGLQKSIKGRAGKHVHFVDDEDFVTIARRSNCDAVDDHVAYVIDAGIRGRVDLQHIHRTPFGDFAT